MKSFEAGLNIDTTKINPSEKDILKVIKKIKKLDKTNDDFNLPVFKAINLKAESKN